MIFLRNYDTFLQANCYILAAGPNQPALVIDPGAGAATFVHKTLTTYNLQLHSVLLTHGHPDHCWDANAVASDLPVYLAKNDHYRMDNPITCLSKDAAISIQANQLSPWQRPRNLLELPADLMQGAGIELVPGIKLRGLPAPGHSEGSTVFFSHFTIPDSLVAEDNIYLGNTKTRPVLFAGDVLFPLGVGRTDLLGGDPTAMDETVRTLKAVVAPSTIVLPGHGPSATMEWMLENNPFLRPFGCNGNCACGNGGCSKQS